MKSFIFISLLSISSFSFAQNKEIEVKADIKSVTIYNSSAEINYQKEVNVPQGKTTIIFTDLTPYIVENTINIKTSSPDIDLVTVTDKINYIKEKRETNSKITSLQDSLELLRNELGLTKCKTEAFRMEKTALSKDASIGVLSSGVTAAEIEKASQFFSKRFTELNTEIYKSDQKELALLKKISNITNQIEEMSTNVTMAGSEIQVIVNNPSAKKVVFDFSFLTAQAGWAPLYDCRYMGANVPLKFIFRANVFNATGISWDDVTIKLSTASPTNGFNAPSFNDKHNSVKQSVEGVKFVDIQVANSIAEYDIQHKYSIPSDSKPYTVDVNSYEMAAEFYYLTIPKLDPYGFLMAKVPNWNKYNLMPGTTNFYNKGSFMGKTFLKTYSANDTINLYLGKDNNIIVNRTEKSSTNENNIIGNYYVDKAEISISIKNNSNESMKIQVLDQVPVVHENSKGKYNIDHIEEALYNKKEGLLTWNITLAQNGSSVISYKYEIKEPKGDNEGVYYKPQKFKTISCPAF